VFGDGAGFVALAALAGLLFALGFAAYARSRQMRTGRRPPVGGVAAVAIVLAPLAAYLLAGRPVSFAYAELRGFNLRGGLQLYPEFVALVFGLVTYTAGFIAEIVRAGVNASRR
jgi:general L-amino acid transport system permease protein